MSDQDAILLDRLRDGTRIATVVAGRAAVTPVSGKGLEGGLQSTTEPDGIEDQFCSVSPSSDRNRP